MLGRGQTLDSVSSADLTQAYAEVYAELEDDHLVTWSSSAAIPDKYVWSMKSLVAMHRLNEYAPPPDRAAQVQINAVEAMRRIRALRETPQTGETKIQNY